MRVQRLDGLELDDEVVRRITQPIIDALSLLGVGISYSFLLSHSSRLALEMR